MKRFLQSFILGGVIFASEGLTTFSQEQEQEEISSQKNFMTSQNRTLWGITGDQLEELFKTSQDYVVLVNDQHLHRVNSRWTEILGWTAEELTSQPFVHFLHPEDIPATKGAVHKGSYVDCVINFENRYRSKKKDVYHTIQWFALRQVSGTKSNNLILGIGKDLTLEKEAEEQRYALQQAEIATRLKSSFVAHMSHEIRTPLNGVMGFLSLALEEEMPSKVRSHVENAYESSQLLLDVANDIIDVSRIEAGVLRIEHINFNPHTTLKSVMTLLNLQARKKGLHLMSSLSPDLPPVLTGDENRLKQILINLLSNAIKFTSQGKVSLKIQGQPQESDPPTFRLQGIIKDTGIGIDADFISKLFQPFSQEDHSMRRQFGGAGLGLYITKQLCERMGGTVSVLSTLGKGSTFQFHVLLGQPYLKSPYLTLKPNFPLVPALSSETLSSLNILVVEDNLMNQKVVTLLLKKLGCTADIAENGQLGLEAVRHKSYDVVLMDGEMPVMDGLQATLEIRKQFSKRQLPIIGLSAHVMSTHQEQFLGAGMNGYLTKPITKDSLGQEIIRCLQAVSHDFPFSTS